MDADEYQFQASRTLIDDVDVPPFSADQIRLVWNAIGLAGEAGEVADLIKKAVFHEHGLDTVALVKELGDVLWYVAALCSVLDVPLSDAMILNIEKLRARYPDGWDTARSQNRTA